MGLIQQYFDKTSHIFIPGITREHSCPGDLNNLLEALLTDAPETNELAQKWLKEHHSRVLLFDDIQHYQKMSVVLVDTDRIMQEINELCEENGGF